MRRHGPSLLPQFRSVMQALVVGCASENVVDVHQIVYGTVLR